MANGDFVTEGQANSLITEIASAVKSGKIHVSTTPPSNTNQIWLDTSVTANPVTGSPFELRGQGSPVGVVTPSAKGVYYTDTNGTSGIWRWVSTGTTNTSWEQDRHTAASFGALVNSATAYEWPIDFDMIPIMDSMAGKVLKKISWSGVLARFKTYFDTFYSSVTHTHTYGAKATKDTAGPTMSSASTWYQLTGFTIEDYDDQSIINPTTGVITIPTAGRWRIVATIPWSSYGSAYDRIVAISSGTSSPSGTRSLAAARNTSSGYWWSEITYEGMFAAGAQATVWMWSNVTSSGINPTADAAPLGAITVTKL